MNLFSYLVNALSLRMWLYYIVKVRKECNAALRYLLVTKIADFHEGGSGSIPDTRIVLLLRP